MRRGRRANLTSTALTVGVLGLSTTMAWVVAYSVHSIFDKYQDIYETVLASQHRPLQVVVAARELHRGSVITDSDLRLHTIGQEFVPLTTITDPTRLVGQVVQERILEGDLIRTERLSEGWSGHGLSATIPVGMRAIGLDLVDGERVSGFVEPGDRVDVVATLPGDDDREAATYTLLQAVEVLAVDEHISPSVTGDVLNATAVTLSVSPAQAEAVTFLDARAMTRLVLRAEIDFVMSESAGASSGELLGEPDQRLTVAEYEDTVEPARAWRELQLYRGAHRTTEVLPLDSALYQAVMEGRTTR